MMTLLLIVLIIALLASVPAWPYSRSWGYYPSGGIGLCTVRASAVFDNVRVTAP
mgnify:CR=1 FL=1